jgi:predicted Zn-dependent peptidase
MSTAFKLFDSACWGSHPAALPVIGSARQVQRLAREDLAAVVAQRYTGANIVVAGAGRIDLQALARRVERAFASVATGTPNDVPPPLWQGGVKVRPLPGSNQAHVVLGLPIAGLCADDPVATLAAAVFGEGMSSPLMDELRERRGQVYYAACSAYRFETLGQFVIEAATAPEHLLQAVRVVLELLQRHAASIDAAELERARKQVLVRRLRALERPGRRVEDSALELLALGRLTVAAETRERLLAITAEQVRQAFADMLAHPLALAATGKVPRTSGQQLREGVDAALGRLRSPPTATAQHA